MRPRQVTDDDLLSAARACFLELGPGCSTNVIAQRAGVSQATLFKRFGTKDELLLKAMLPRGFEAIFATMQAGPDARPAGPQLVEIGREFIEFFEAMVPCVTVMHAAGVGPHKREWSEDDPPIRGRILLAAWMRRAVTAGLLRPHDEDALSIALLGAFQTIAFRRHMLNDDPFPDGSDDYLGALIGALVGGIGPLGAAP